MTIRSSHVYGQGQVYLGDVVIELHAFDGVIEMTFHDANTGERYVCRPLRVRVAGDDLSGQIIDVRLPEGYGE